MSCNGDEECDIRPGTVTPKKLPKQSGGGGHEFVTELPETGDEGVEYVLMDDFSDCSTYRGTFVWNEDCGGWIQTSGSGGGAIERYTFEQTANGWRAKRNNTVIFTYVDKDTIDSYENTATGFKIIRGGSIIFEHTDGGGGDCPEYTAESTPTGWQLLKDGVVIFTYVDKNDEYIIEGTDDGWVFKENGVTKFTYTEPANDPSDGTYFTSGTLTTVIGGTSTIAASAVTGLVLADVVIGETLIYDEFGSVGRVTAVTGTNLTVETITTAPGERRGTRLGAVDDYTDLPATCAAATALGWQTPLAGDFAYVREDASHDDHLTEWVISSIDGSCNITWAYSHTLNAGNYVLDIYKYGDYPSGNPIPKNADGSVTLPKDEDTKYDFESTADGWRVKDHETGTVLYTYVDVDTDTKYDFEDVTSSGVVVGWRVKDHDTGTVLFTHTDVGDTTYDFEAVTVGGEIVGWRVKDGDTGSVLFTYTDLNDKSDGTYFTSTTLDTDITDQTTVPASTVTGLTLADVVVGETLIYDGDGTVGVVTAVNGTDLTVDTITVAGSGDASSYVYKTTGSFDTTVDNTTNVALSTLSDASGNTPTASDIIIGKTLAWDDDGTVALAVAISGTDVTFKTMTVAGAGGSGTYYVDDRGDELKSAYAKLDSNWTPSNGATVPLVKKSGDFEQPSVGVFTIPDGMRIEIAISVSQYPHGDISFGLYNNTDNGFIPNVSMSDPWVKNNYFNSSVNIAQWTNDTGHNVDISYRISSVSQAGTFGHFTHATLKEIGRVVDPIKYLDNSEGLQDTPVGNIISYMGNNVPRHYLACDGTIYNVGDYPALEAHFIEEFGSVNYFGGNGTTTWAVPDLQGEFLRGTGTNSHPQNGDGANVGVHQDATTVPYVRNLRGANNLVQFRDGGSSAQNVAPSNMDYSNTGAGFGNINFDASGSSTIDTLQRDYTTRPTNTSVKYCIKYESTMQVILGADQYAVRGTFARSTTTTTWQLNTLTATAGDTSLVKSGVFYAPEDGYYQLTANVGWTTGAGLWMTWQRQATALSGNTQAITNANMLLNNTGDPGGTGGSGIMREALSGAVWLNKDDPVTLQTFCRTVPDANGKYEWSIVRLTGSVDINEINLVAADDVYSADEQLVGSYLGKPLYKKTVTTTINSTTSNIVPYSALSANVDKTCIVKYKGRMTNADTGNTVTGIPCYYADAAFVDCFFQNNGIHIVAGTQYGVAGRICEITYYYTKTSDTAGSAPNKNSLLLTRPDLWTPGTEYDFGGGLYGYRKTGTITVAANTEYNITPIIPSTSTAKIISYGGWVTYNNNTDAQMQLGYNQAQSAGDSYSAAFYVNSNGISLTSCTTVARTNAPYDVWVTYTK